MPVLNESALQGIASHKYVSGDYTWLDIKMQPWWNWVAERMPWSFHPNLITLLGTLGVVLGYSVWVPYSPNFYYEEAPLWVYLAAAGGIFWSQTMDAVDGKQARRTGASSPLGQMFDHGCDAFSTHLLSLMAASAVGSGTPWKVMFLFVSPALCFWFGTVAEYHTGKLQCNDGTTGVTEGQIMLIGIQLLSAVKGPWLWNTPIVQPGSFQLPLVGYSLELSTPFTLGDVGLILNAYQTLRFCFVVACLIITQYTEYDIILANGFEKPKAPLARTAEPKMAIGRKQRGLKAAVLQSSIGLLMAGLAYGWTDAFAQGGQEMEEGMGLRVILHCCGMLFAWQTTVLIVAHMALQPVPMAWQAWVPCLFAASNTVYGWADPYTTNAIVLSWLCLSYLVYVICVINEITTHLKIQCFSMAYLKSK